MKKATLVVYLLLFQIVINFTKTYGQQVVVNEYFNAADPRDEWFELLVVTDNTDMRNWTVRDNNSSQTAWQVAATFNNSSFWNNMRAGTIIIIWNRPVSSTSVTHPLDVNKTDGYIELDATNSIYFTGGSFGTSPTWAGNTLNYAGSGDVVELRDGSATHIHALGHASTAGADWTAMPTPKLNHANSANSGDAIYACPAAVITDYNGPATGNAFTSKNNSTLTFGLPNTCGSSTTGNTTFVDGLREPIITAQSITPSVSVPGNITFSWITATDPNPSDNTIGYMILRNTSNVFTAPVDGTTYAVSGTLGSATIIGEINSSGTTTYTDNNVIAGNCYYYRVYAFRYAGDDMTGTAFGTSISRGRAYNQTNFVFVDCQSLIVLPIKLLNFTAIYNSESTVDLKWQTATETNNDFFTVERSINAIDFEELAKINGAGNSIQILSYSCKDKSPLTGISYYRLKQTDFDGKFECSETVPVTINNDLIENIYPNPATEKLTIELKDEKNDQFKIKIFDCLGQQLYYNEKVSDNSLTIDLSEFDKGIYLLIIDGGEKSYQQKFIKQ